VIWGFFLKISILFEDTFSGIKAFLKWCEAFQKIRGFFKTFKEKLRLFPVMWGTIWRSFKDIFREVEAIDYKWGFCKNYAAFGRNFQWNGGFNKKSEALTKITKFLRLFLKRCEVFSKNSRLFKMISR
jgi:hypothetical protein